MTWLDYQPDSINLWKFISNVFSYCLIFFFTMKVSNQVKINWFLAYSTDTIPSSGEKIFSEDILFPIRNKNTKNRADVRVQTPLEAVIVTYPLSRRIVELDGRTDGRVGSRLNFKSDQRRR